MMRLLTEPSFYTETVEVELPIEMTALSWIARKLLSQPTTYTEHVSGVSRTTHFSVECGVNELQIGHKVDVTIGSFKIVGLLPLERGVDSDVYLCVCDSYTEVDV